jgi:hypothetical protein
MSVSCYFRQDLVIEHVDCFLLLLRKSLVDSALPKERKSRLSETAQIEIERDCQTDNRP